MVLTVKNLVIFEVVKGLAPWASVWCGGECPHAYPVKSLPGGSYSRYRVCRKVDVPAGAGDARDGTSAGLRRG